MIDLTQIQAKADAAITKRAAPYAIKCGAGCSACCHQLFYCSLAEAVQIAEKHSDKIESKMAELTANASAALKSNNHAAYFGRPCVFLEDRQCTIYEDRPLACRAHLVTSDPEKCSDPKALVHKLETRELVGSFSAQAMKATDLPPIMAPFPVAIMLALETKKARLQGELQEVPELALNLSEGVLRMPHGEGGEGL